MSRIPMGMAHIYYDPDSKGFEFEKSRLRTVEGGRDLYYPDERAPDFGDDDDGEDGDEDGEDEDGEDEDGEDEDGEDEDDDGEDEDDDGEDDSGDESGGKASKRRKARRAKRKKLRQSRRAKRKGKTRESSVRKVSSVETVTSATPTVAGQELTLEFRADEKFVIDRLTFAGDDDARLKSIFIGRQAIFNSSNGTRLSEFKSSNLQTLKMKGTVIPRGAYIRVKIEASAALAQVDANLYGLYHEQRSC